MAIPVIYVGWRGGVGFNGATVVISDQSQQPTAGEPAMDPGSLVTPRSPPGGRSTSDPDINNPFHVTDPNCYEIASNDDDIYRRSFLSGPPHVKRVMAGEQIWVSVA